MFVQEQLAYEVTSQFGLGKETEVALVAVRAVVLRMKRAIHDGIVMT